MSPRPEIDFSRLDFPSDGVGVKTLRRMRPEVFDSAVDLATGPEIPESMIEDLHCMLHSERYVADMAFHVAMGRSVHPENLGWVETHIKDLTELYAEYGIASGSHAAEQLIREIQSQAARQARELTGRTP